MALVPTFSLDTATGLLRGVRQVLVVEQNAAIALAHADDGYIMELGRVVAAGTCAELMAKDDVKEFYLGASQQAEPGNGQKKRWKRRKTWR